MLDVVSHTTATFVPARAARMHHPHVKLAGPAVELDFPPSGTAPLLVERQKGRRDPTCPGVNQIEIAMARRWG